MYKELFSKFLCSILAAVLIFTSLPINHLKVEATENTEIEKEKSSTPSKQNELPAISSGEAPPFEATEPQEVPELRTESSKVIDNGDGTYTMQMFQEPVFRKNSGKWREIQPEIKKQKAGKFFAAETTSVLSTDNTLLDIQFSPQLNENKYAVLSYKGHTISYSFIEAYGEEGVQKAKSTDATYDENKIVYKDILSGLTLRNLVFDGIVKEDIILSHENGTNAYKFFVETDLTAKLEETGSITFRNSQNEVIFTLPKPYMTDSNVNPESTEPERSENVHFELKQDKSGYAFTVVADETWLKDPKRVYPVYIDPTTKVQANEDASVSDAYPNANYGSDWDSGLGAFILKAGNYSTATGENFAYIKTPTPSLPYATIETAIFNIYNIHSYYHDRNTGIWLDRVNGPWDESTLNWKNKPTSSLFTSTSVYKGNWATFNVKNAVNDWIKGTTPNYGFKLHTNGNGQTFWKKFYSYEHGVADYRPHLNISYSYPSPTNLSAKSTSLGDGTGYIDLQWSPVAGASSYKVWIFDGNVYKSINVGKNTNWSTKDKSVWPQVGGNLPVNPQAVYRASGGTTYNNRTNYAISVSAVFSNGESPNANPIVPTIPNLTMPNAPNGVAYSNQIGTNSGYFNLEWEPINGATGYKVWIFNGLSYEAFDVKDATSWTTQNKGIWPNPEEVKNGNSATLKLHQDGKGLELPVDPSPMYAKMGTKYATSKNFFFRLSAYNAHGETVFSNDTLITKMPQGTEFLGAEDYWTMIDVPNGTVNAATGNLLINESDISIIGNGPGLGIARTYNSLSKNVGLFGKGWHSDAEMSIVAQGQDAKLTDEDGTVHLFNKQPDKSYKAPTGVYLELRETTDSQYKLTTKDQTSYYFSKSTGKLSKIMDGFNKSTEYSFKTDRIEIKDVSGRQITLLLNTDGQVEKIEYPLQRSITFEYNSINPDLLEKVIDHSGQVTKYEYNPKQDLEKLYEPRHLDPKETKSIPVITTFEYKNDRLEKVTDAENNIYSLDYKPSLKLLYLTKPNGKKVQYKFNEAGNPIQQIDDEGKEGLNLTTNYEYVGNNLEGKIDPKDQGKIDPKNPGENLKTESYQYEDGNVTEATDSYGTESYLYNDNNDITLMEDTEGRKTTIAYDGLNPVTAIDQSGKVSSMSKFDKYGNTIESSADLGVANNLLKNSSFEEGTASWLINSLNNTGTMAIDTNTSDGLNGKKTLKINVLPTGVGYIAATQEITVQSGVTYTLSGKVKTNLSKANTLFKVEMLDSQNKLISSVDNRYSQLAGARTWTDRQLTFKTSDNATKIRIYLQVEHQEATAKGEAWFDAVQLEKAEVPSSYNPILNSSFESENTNWVGTGGTIDNIVENAFDDNKSLKISRSTDSAESIVYKQSINVGQTTSNKAIPMTLTGLSKSNNVQFTGQENKKDYSIAAKAYYADNTTKDFYAEFPIGTQDWNRSAITIAADKPVSKMEISLIFKGTYTGTVWFDGIRLMEGSAIIKNSYDQNGYQNGTEDELGHMTSSNFDILGNKEEDIDAKGTKKSYKYNLSNLLEDLLLPNGTNIHYDYDKNGNMKLKSITDKLGKTQLFQYEYDGLDALTHTTGPSNDITINIYDENGNKTETLMPRGNSIQSKYDGVDRIESISYNNDLYYKFEYDKNGNEEFVTYVKEGRKKEREYDSSNRVKTLKDRGGIQNWSYLPKTDKLDSFTFTQGSFSQVNNYKYNSLDQNTIVTAGGYTYRFDYDEKGNVQTFATGNGAGSTFSYDNRGLVKNLTIGAADGSNILTEKYTYDPNGNRTEIQYPLEGTSGTSVSYQYDDLDQLEIETLRDGTVNKFEYDGFGNRVKVTVINSGKTTSKSAVYNIANQLEQFGDEIIDYDANGNRELDGKYTYGWNDADQLVSVTKLGSTIPFATYQYNEDGKRIQKKVNGVVTNYHYDGDSLNVLYETDGQNNVVRSYTYSEGGQMLSMKKGTETFFYHYNAHGDVIALTDQSGQRVATYEYDAWGNVITSDEEDQVKDNPYRYAGYQYDHETGLYYLIARYYQPQHGVFLSLDPDPGDSDDILTQNGYTYANNNPVMLVDPDGHWVWLAVNAGFAAYDGYKAYKSGKSKKQIAWAVASNFIKVGKVSKLYHFAKKAKIGRADNLTPSGAKRRGAFREAKRKNGIPMSQQPKGVSYPATDKKNRKIPGRDYDFGGGNIIRDHSAGHKYKDNPSQNRGPHFNDRNKNHYNY